jgi:ABC-type multidrug transport system ATPase subunit
MDPQSRRAAWAFIQAQKPGRTLLLTTHNMEGANASM